MPGAELLTRTIEPITPQDVKSEESFTTSPWLASIEAHPSWPTLAELRITLTVAVALHCFTVNDLLEMHEGQVFETLSPTADDVPLMIGRLQLGWCEFEAMERRMAVRLTRLG